MTGYTCRGDHFEFLKNLSLPKGFTLEEENFHLWKIFLYSSRVDLFWLRETCAEPQKIFCFLGNSTCKCVSFHLSPDMSFVLKMGHY